MSLFILVTVVGVVSVDVWDESIAVVNDSVAGDNVIRSSPLLSDFFGIDAISVRSDVALFFLLMSEGT